MSKASTIIQKVWGYAHVLKDDGLAFMDYAEQITYLLFLKMAWEQGDTTEAAQIPKRYNWNSLKSIPDDESLAKRYHQTLRKLSEQPGLLGLIFTKPQSKINDPAKLRLLVEMIDRTNWSSLSVDVKGEVYEGLLARNAEDVRGGAGQYFTPRPVIRAVVAILRPTPLLTVSDPACGTGGFLLGAYEFMKRRVRNETEDQFLHNEALHGCDIVPNVARLCAMNLYLHGIGSDAPTPLVSIGDSLASRSTPVDMVLTNPPFGRKSSITVYGEDGRTKVDNISYDRDDLWATTSNKQLNFVQHVYSVLKGNGQAAVVVPDNVLFEGGAGERIRRNLLASCNVHTLLRLPTGIWYSPGVKANVIFFDKLVPGKSRHRQELWIYDLRTNMNFTLRENPITDNDLTDFIQSCRPEDRSKRIETNRFKRFAYHELLAREKVSFDVFWLKEDSDRTNRTTETPKGLARAIVSDLEEAMLAFGDVERELEF